MRVCSESWHAVRTDRKGGEDLSVCIRMGGAERKFRRDRGRSAGQRKRRCVYTTNEERIEEEGPGGIYRTVKLKVKPCLQGNHIAIGTPHLYSFGGMNGYIRIH